MRGQSTGLEKWNSTEHFRAHINEWANRIQVKPKRVYIRPMKNKWASCSTRGLVSFSTELLAEDRAFGEYVIVHELLHLKVPNHGRLFKSLLRAYLPDWEEPPNGIILCGIGEGGTGD